MTQRTIDLLQEALAQAVSEEDRARTEVRGLLERLARARERLSNACAIRWEFEKDLTEALAAPRVGE